MDRRFNRARYDADQIAAAFAARLKDTVDLGSVRDDLTGIVARALEPAHVSVWVSRHQGGSWPGRRLAVRQVQRGGDEPVRPGPRGRLLADGVGQELVGVDARPPRLPGAH